MSEQQFGFERLAAQVAEILASEWEWMQDEPGALRGQSKIEKLLITAVQIRGRIGLAHYDELLFTDTLELFNHWLDEPTRGVSLVVWPQAQVLERKIDFLFGVMSSWGVKRCLLVECDGHNFHSRTKSQVARDRRKDRAATLSGVEFFRFTGSEIWRSPLDCAEQIDEWVAGGFNG